jgi:TonB family protein
MIFALLSSAVALALTPPQMVSPPPAPKGIPPTALEREGGVDIILRVKISPKGEVEQCSPIVLSSYPDFDLRVCDRVTRSTFKPGTDADGAPIYGITTLQIHFEKGAADERVISPDLDLTLDHMPADSSVHPKAQVAILVDPEGHVEDCRVFRPSGVAAVDSQTCKVATATAPFEPVRDDTGRAVRSVQAITVGFGAYAKVIFKRDSAYAALGPAGPFSPERAQRLGVSGYAILDCASNADGALTNCLTKDEAPAGYGFGPAARLMALRGWMKAAPGSGKDVVVRVEFPSQAHFRRF